MGVLTEELRGRLAYKKDFFLKQDTVQNVKNALSRYGEKNISFSQFCMIIHGEVKESQAKSFRVAARSIRISASSKAPTMKEIYLADSDSDDDNILIKVNHVASN